MYSSVIRMVVLNFLRLEQGNRGQCRANSASLKTFGNLVALLLVYFDPLINCTEKHSSFRKKKSLPFLLAHLCNFI